MPASALSDALQSDRPTGRGCLNEWQATPWLGIAVAGGAGLLIGLERERRKQQPGHVAFAGVRTFTMAALAGAIAQPSLNHGWSWRVRCCSVP